MKRLFNLNFLNKLGIFQIKVLNLQSKRKQKRMKSIKEKARAYDEALEKAKAWCDCEHATADDKILLKRIFPELVESEDERIRKSLIDMLKNDEKCYLEEIAWLEKQGEQKSINNLTLQEAMDIAVAKCFEEGEQKPAWSEENELHIRELESLVKQVWATAERGNDKETIHKMSDLSFFLKTLKPQPKQEWSEEDEKKRNLLISILNVNHPNDYFKVNPANTLNMEAIHTEELVDWLKSLKPQ